MAKDGTMRGGARIGSGKKRKSLDERIQEGTTAKAKVLNVLEADPEEDAPIKDYLDRQQADGSVLRTREVMKLTKAWLKAMGCEALVPSQLVEQYALEFVRRHASIPAVDDFHFDEYEDFIAYARDKEFDYRSSARALFDEMKKSLEEDGLTEAMGSELDALAKSLDMDKETFLRLKKDEIIPFIEEEIVVRYYFQEAGVKVRIRYDEQLAKALEVPAITY